MSKLLILVDGSSYLYRAFHALPALTNSKGRATGAVYGVINMIRRLISDYHPEYMAIVFDAKGKTFRDTLYAAYKANRQAMPPDLGQQIDPLHQIIKAMGIPLIMIEGVEADDVIGTLVQKATLAKMKSVVSTGDKDLAQLVNENIMLVNTMTNTKLDPTGVKEKFGVMPHQIIDYLTLIGDSSDNIPGVPKVGPKTAVKWLQEYGTLDALIQKADQITGKVGENLRSFIPQIPLTQSLVRIKLDVPCELEIEDLKLTPAQKPTLIALYKELEFKSWLNELLLDAEKKDPKKYENYIIITEESVLDEWISKLKQVTIFSFDTETTHIDHQFAQLIGLSFAIAPLNAVYIPLAHAYKPLPKQLSKALVLKKLKPIFEDPTIKKVAQNLKYDAEVLLKENIIVENCIFDTMIESYLLDSAATNHSLDTLALKYLGWRTISYADLAGKGTKQLSFDQIAIDKAGQYAAEDADVTLQIHHTLYPRLENEPRLQKLFHEIEMPLVPVLAKMERIGVLIDPNKLIQQGKELEKRLKTLEKEAFKLAEGEFNLNSPKQLQEILFQKLKLPVLQKTPTGQPSTADAVLQELALEFKLPGIIIEYRSLSKLISTYTSKLVSEINPQSGRVHTTFNQTGTATGRLSSSEPNLQNIPIRSKEGRRIRQAFIAPKPFRLLSCDYSQIELRLMAHLSNDPNLIAAFNSNLDIHQATAAEVWGVPPESVTADMRRDAKAINFGLIYGMSAFGLTKQLGISNKEAQNYIERYFSRYPNVMNYMTNIKEKARVEGYVETLWGRRLYLPDLRSSQIARQKAAERIAINAPLQGSAADIIKLAMIAIHHWLEKEKFQSKLILQVHDELVFEAHPDEMETLILGVKKRMTEVMTLNVPILVSIGIGDNWEEASDHSQLNLS